MATTPTAAALFARFPEFQGAAGGVDFTSLANAKLEDAAARTDESVWGALWTQGVMYKAAQLLAKTPYGRKMGLVNKDGSTAYDGEVTKLTRIVSSGFRLA